MNYRSLGATDLRLSDVGFGCGTTAALMVKGAEKERLKVIGNALEAGITYFDTAPVYGDGQSETHLGQDLRQLGAHPVVGTKVALGPADLDDVYGAVIRSVDASLGRLQMDGVDILHLHNRLAEHRSAESGVAVGPLLSIDDLLGPRGVLEAFRTLQRQGKTRYFGICAFGGEMPAVKRAIDSASFHSVLAYYNLLNPSAGQPKHPATPGPDYGQVIDYAADRGVGVVALRVLAAGALAIDDKTQPASDGRGRTGQQFEQDSARARAIAGLAEELGASPVTLAIQFALRNDKLSTVLVGISEQTHLDQALAATSAPPLPPDIEARLEELYNTDFGLQTAAP